MIEKIWETFLTIAHEEVGSRVVETWFKAIVLCEWDVLQKVIYLKAPNTFVKDWVCKHYLPLFELHLGRLLTIEQPKIIFLQDHAEKKEIIKKEIPIQASAVAKAMTDRSHKAMPDTIIPASVAPAEEVYIKPASVYPDTTPINRNYVFDTFIVGPSNSLAYAAAQAVTKHLGSLYNPLFVYGGSGLGKTHLLHAIGNDVRESYKHTSILYQTADRFVSEFIQAIRFNKMHAFQTKYQRVDLLLIDDVQFIANKEQTQEAFFHIFNALYSARKQIVFSSDSFPQNIQGIAERLRSRLCCGLVADIYAPSIETKMAILKQKALLHHASLDDEVAQYIAATITSNIRELEGALIRIMATASLSKQPITIALVKHVLAGITPQRNGNELERIGRLVAQSFSYTVQDLQSKSRSKELVLARQAAMYLMKKYTDKSLREIGEFLGGRDHATVLHALEKMNNYAQQEPKFYQKVQQLAEEIKR